MKNINSLCGQNVEFLNVKPGATRTARSWKVTYNPIIFTRSRTLRSPPTWLHCDYCYDLLSYTIYSSVSVRPWWWYHYWILPLVIFPKLNKNAHLICILHGDRCSASNIGHFTPREELPLPFEQEVGWAPEPSWILWRERKTFVVQTVTWSLKKAFWREQCDKLILITKQAY